jgi:adenosylcobinamide-GDP ribazoletransferase
MPIDSRTLFASLSLWRDDVHAAAAFLTRFPLADAPLQDSRTLRAYPVIGLGLGLAGGLAASFAMGIGLPPLLAAVAAVAVGVLATGALHEDGLADFADGLAGRHRDDSLAIMRDARIGTFGVLALVLSLIARIGAIAALAAAGAAIGGLIAAAALSRGLIALLAAREHPAREDGLGAELGTPAPATVYTALAIASVIALASLGPMPAILALALATGAMLALARVARMRLGGYTGDVLGATQQICEIAVLWTAAAFWGQV